MSVLVINHVSLDGVLQGPGRPDEDVRDGFAHGGWAQPASDPAMAQAMGQVMRPALLLVARATQLPRHAQPLEPGRRSSQEGLNQVRKYVASSDPAADLPWPNSTLVGGDVPARVAELREQDSDLVIMGSGQLIRSLLPHSLVDDVLLFIHPVVLGSGRRLFGPDDQARRLRLLDSSATSTGVLIATYEVQSASR